MPHHRDGRLRFSRPVQEALVLVAQDEAAKAAARGDNCFGAVLVDASAHVVARAGNTVRTQTNTVAHAEINLLSLASALLQRRDLSDYAVAANAAPCSMCMSALVKAKIAHIYYGAPNESDMDPFITPAEIAEKTRMTVHLVGGVREADCIKQIERARAAQQIAAGRPVPRTSVAGSS